jgi:hypothetical protein
MRQLLWPNASDGATEKKTGESVPPATSVTRKTREEVCPQCGEVVRAETRFCSLCGAQMPAETMLDVLRGEKTREDFLQELRRVGAVLGVATVAMLISFWLPLALKIVLVLAIIAVTAFYFLNRIGPGG